MGKIEKRSPIKEKPLRHAGQSIDEEIKEIISEEIDLYLIYGFLWILVAIFEWVRWFTKMPYQPITFTICALVVVLFSASKVIILKRKINDLRLAREGERAVGQYLEMLRRAFPPLLVCV